METKELYAALVAFQADLKPVDKSAANPFFKSKYAPLPAVMEVIQPLLAEHGLAVCQMVTRLEGQSALRTILVHKSGQSIQDTMPLLLTKADPQSQGSAITYARRYAIMAALGVVADEDDDGNAASGKVKAAPRATAKKDAPKPATQEQLDTIRRGLAAVGTADDAAKRVLDQVKTQAQANELIKKLAAKVKATKQDEPDDVMLNDVDVAAIEKAMAS